MQVDVSARARLDLLDILTYGIAEFGERQGEGYYWEVFSVFERLALYPELGKERSDTNPPMRFYIYRMHIIVYRISDDAIQIVRVVGARQDWQQIL